MSSMNTAALPWDHLKFVQGEPLNAKQAIANGQIVILELWATWCPPCRSSIPHLNSLHQQFSKHGVQMIGITNENDENKIKKFIAGMGNKMTYRVALDTQDELAEWQDRFKVGGIPHAFIIDRSGMIRWSGHPMEPSFVSKVEELIKEAPAKPAVSANELRDMSDDDLKAKPVKELIALLKGAHIDISGCLEKQDFIDRLRGKAAI